MIAAGSERRRPSFTIFFSKPQQSDFFLSNFFPSHLLLCCTKKIDHNRNDVCVNCANKEAAVRSSCSESPQGLHSVKCLRRCGSASANSSCGRATDKQTAQHSEPSGPEVGNAKGASWVPEVWRRVGRQFVHRGGGRPGRQHGEYPLACGYSFIAACFCWIYFFFSVVDKLTSPSNFGLSVFFKRGAALKIRSRKGGRRCSSTLRVGEL